MPEVIERVEDHCADGLELLLSQFQNKPRLAGVLCALLESVQEAEDAAWQLLTERDLDSAVGAQLDQLGRLVGEERQGRTDDQYRPFVRGSLRDRRRGSLPRPPGRELPLQYAAASQRIGQRVSAAFRKPSGVCPVQRLNARWNALPSA